MEATGSTTTKKKKVGTNGRGGGGGGGGEEEDLDLISKLPDSLLHHILSYLKDMTTVIQTCFLSKRWRYIWSSLPFLNFDDGFHSSNVRLPFFITRALVFRNHNSNIQTFRVFHVEVDDFFIGNISTHIVTWIHLLTQICSNNNNNSVALQVFDFHVVVLTDFIFKLPACFQSLTTLKLDLGSDDVVVSRPPCFKLSAADGTGTISGLCLPALKTLHLKSMYFENWVDVEMLIAGSPVLQNFVFSNCFYRVRSPLQELNICHAQLQSLVIEKMYSCDEIVLRPYTRYYTYESCRFNVFAPKLVSFISTDHFDLINGYSFVNVSSLDNAEIYTVLDPVLDRECDLRALKKNVYIVNVIDCLRGIYNVRSLKISAWLLELVTEVPGGLESLPMAPFYNLRILMLKTSSSKYQIRAGMYLLEKCPSLETLILKMTKVKSVSVEEEECWEAELAPQCIMHHLKLVEIWDVLTSANELEYLKFLLKNAIVLEKLKVLSSKKQPPNNNDLEIFGAKLKSFCGAASSRTEILFQFSGFCIFTSVKKGGMLGSRDNIVLPQTCRDLRCPSQNLVVEVPERLKSLQIRPFHNLSYLQLKTSFSKNHACAIMFLLGKCPNLGTLVLKVTEARSVSVEEEGFWEAELAPQCNMHHLKLVEIWDVFASVNELEFLKFLLKNATGLEKMVVVTPKGQFPENDKRFKEFGEKLISFRGASSSVQIVFV